MDLSRVYVGPQNTVSLLIPQGWDVWTWEGVRFERDAVNVWQQVSDGWMPCVVEPKEFGEERRESA